MTLDEYLRRPYTKTLCPDNEGNFIARVVEFPGCMAHGETEVEALAELAEVQKAWLEIRLEDGLEIPEPAGVADLPSGKWLQRVPRSLHAKLVELAERDGVSLNQYVTSVLAERAGAGTTPTVQAVEDKWSGVCYKMWTGVSAPLRLPEPGHEQATVFLHALSNQLPSDLSESFAAGSVRNIYGEKWGHCKQLQRVPTRH